MIRVVVPAHLKTLIGTRDEIHLDVAEPVCQASLLDALEAGYPVLRGTVRDRSTLLRRPFIRYFACEEDLSHRPADEPLPEAVREGREPFIIIGAMAGG